MNTNIFEKKSKKNIWESVFLKKIFHFRNQKWNEEMLEVTYAYDIITDQNAHPIHNEFDEILAYNQLFYDITNVSYQDIISKKISVSEVLIRAENEIEKRIKILEDLIKESEFILCNKNKKNLIVSTLQSYKNRLRMAFFWLKFEMEKAGFIVDFSWNEKKEKIKKIQSLQTEEFGEDVSESWAASEQVLYKIRSNFHKQRHWLLPEEVEKMEQIYTKMADFLRKKFRNKNIENLYDFVEKVSSRDDLKKFSKIMIPREEYVQIFQAAITMMGLHQKVKIESGRSSIFDGHDVLWIPDNDEYKELSLERILELISHEIRSHYVNQKNGENFLEGIRSVGDIEKEEGLAMLMEGLIRGQNFMEISRSKRGSTEARILLSEVFPGDRETIRMAIHLFEKIKNEKSVGDLNQAMLRRASRNLPYWYTQKKDLSYGRGLERVIDFLKNGGDIKALFNGKFGINSIENGQLDFLDDTKKVFPFFIEDVIIYYYEQKIDQCQKMHHPEFIAFLRKKYGYILSDSDFEHLENCSFSNIQSVCSILSHLNKNR